MFRAIVAIAILLSLGGSGLCVKGCVSGCGADYSEGDRIGSITKFSNKGLFIKSWEGQLNLGGFVTKHSDKGDSLVANTWNFTVTKPELVDKIQHAMVSGKPVKIHYRQWFNSPMSMDSNYEAVTVDVVN